jgi:hypothetical protein
MQLTGVRRALFAVVLALPLGGGAALGLGADAPTAPGTPSASGDTWVVVATGSATPSPIASRGTPSTSPSAGLPSRSPAPDCEATWPSGQVLIPVTVTSGPGSLTVTWPRYGSSSTYRIAAVPQELVAGDQPSVVWQPVPGGTGCTVSGTIRGLTAGRPYVVWLDAPGTGFLRDGSRNPYSGRSGVVRPG